MCESVDRQYIYEEREYRQELERLAIREMLSEDPVAQTCRYRIFASRSNGRGRKPRRRWRDIELLTYNGDTFQIKDGRGKIDVIASEVLGGSVPAQDVEAEFLDRLRRLPGFFEALR